VPPAGQLNYVTAIVIAITQIAAQAAAAFDLTIAGLEGGSVVIPCINPGAVGNTNPIIVSLPNPVRSNGAVAVTITGTPTANTRVSASIYGWVSP
jgi:hypothetical protein